MPDRKDNFYIVIMGRARVCPKVLIFGIVFLLQLCGSTVAAVLVN